MERLQRPSTSFKFLLGLLLYYCVFMCMGFQPAIE